MHCRYLATLPALKRLTSCLSITFALVVIVFTTVGCGDGAKTDEIVIGHFASMTGSEATFGKSTDNGIKLAIEEINANGGINGKKIRLITVDDKGDNNEVGTAVTRLISKDKVIAVLGEVASSRSLAAAPVCQESSVPMVSPSSTNEDVTKKGDMIFRVCYIDAFQGSVCAQFARNDPKVKAKTAAILYDQSAAYSDGLQKVFENSFVKLGGEIVTKQTFQSGDQDFSAQLTAIRTAKPEVIFVPAYYNDVGNIALQARKLGITTPLLGGDGWESPKLAEIAGKSIDGCFYSNHYSPEDPAPLIQEFLKKFKAKYGEVPDSLAACGYDAAGVLAEAMKRAKSLSGKDIAAELAKTSGYKGITGTITLDANRNAVKPAVILEMKGGTPVYVTTIQPGE